MAEDVKTAAEPSAAATAVVEPQFNAADQYTWSQEQREHWNQTGEQPVPPKKQDSAPASTPEKKGVSEPKGKTAAEPETARPQDKKDRKPGEKKTADERIADLIAENKRLKEEQERSRASATQPTSKEPTKDAAKEPTKAAEAPKRPNPFTWKGTAEDYEKAMDTWEAHQKQQAVSEYQMNQRFAAAQEQMKTMVEDAKARYADYETTVKPAVEQLFASAKDIPEMVQVAVNRTPHLADVLYVLGGDQKALQDFINTAKTDPVAAIHKLFFVEQEVTKELAKAKGDGKAADAKGEAKPGTKETPVEPKPRAPKPPSEVGGRGAPGERPDVEAARTGDFRSFEAEQRRRAAAGLR